MTDLPPWADASLSRDLPVLRSRGEGQELEYMERFPENVRDLAKEIAAFATANGGLILVGVTDDGGLVGLPGAEQVAIRDGFLKRLEGITRGAVTPSLTPSAKFAVENDKVVLAISVPKGSQPVYYSHNIPYVRHLTEARPANPHEVVELVKRHLAARPVPADGASDGEEASFHGELALLLIQTLIYLDEVSEREVNPWLDGMRSTFDVCAGALRQLAAGKRAEEKHLASRLNELAEALDDFSNAHRHLGDAEDIEVILQAIRRHADALYREWVADAGLSPNTLAQIREAIVATTRKVEGLSGRAMKLADSGRIEDLQSEASALGYELLQLSYYNLQALGDGVAERLRAIGRALHVIETVTIYMDGGQSVDNVVGEIKECARALGSLAAEIRHRT